MRNDSGQEYFTTRGLDSACLAESIRTCVSGRESVEVLLGAVYIGVFFLARVLEFTVELQDLTRSGGMNDGVHRRYPHQRSAF